MNVLLLTLLALDLLSFWSQSLTLIIFSFFPPSSDLADAAAPATNRLGAVEFVQGKVGKRPSMLDPRKSLASHSCPVIRRSAIRAPPTPAVIIRHANLYSPAALEFGIIFLSNTA